MVVVGWAAVEMENKAISSSNLNLNLKLSLAKFDENFKNCLSFELLIFRNFL